MAIVSPNYTMCPNYIYDNLRLFAKKPTAKLVLDAITRQTFGFQMVARRISLSRLEEMTGLSRTTIIDGIKFLIEEDLIEKVPSGNSFLYGMKMAQVDGEDEDDTLIRKRMISNPHAKPVWGKNSVSAKPAAQNYTNAASPTILLADDSASPTILLAGSSQIPLFPEVDSEVGGGVKKVNALNKEQRETLTARAREGDKTSRPEETAEQQQPVAPSLPPAPPPKPVVTGSGALPESQWTDGRTRIPLIYESDADGAQITRDPLLGQTSQTEWFGVRGVQKVILDKVARARDLGMEPPAFTLLVNAIGAVGGLSAALEQDSNVKMLWQTQEDALALAGMGYRTPEQIESLARQWANENRGKKFPTGTQLIRTASQLKAGGGTQASNGVKKYGTEDRINSIRANRTGRDQFGRNTPEYIREQREKNTAGIDWSQVPDELLNPPEDTLPSM